jgi:hypothetical protein
MEPELPVAFFTDACFFSGYRISSDTGWLMNKELFRLWKESVFVGFTEQRKLYGTLQGNLPYFGRTSLS